MLTKKLRLHKSSSYKDKTLVLGLVDPNGNVSAHFVDNIAAETLNPIIDSKVVKYVSIVVTDEWLVYKGLLYDYTRVVINLSEKKFVLRVHLIRTELRTFGLN